MASNISVAITVDNKQYIAGVNAANTATQTFSKNAVKSLDNVSLVSNNLISRIGGLKTALTGLVSATAIQSANNFANAIKDIAVTTDLGIDSVLGLGRAFELNGGSAEGAQQAILKFADNIAQARAGNQTAIKSFNDIGISVDTLNKNGIEELTKKSIAGIAGLSSSVAQIRGQTDLFGKSAKGISFAGVQQTQQSQFISPETIAALKSGADASENMKKQFGQLTEALLLVSKPLNDIAKNINITAEAFASLIKAILGAIAVYFIFAKAITALNAFFTAFAASVKTAGGAISLVFGFLIKQLFGIYAGLKAFFVNLGRVVGLFKTANGGVASFGFALNGVLRAFLRFAGVAGIIYTVVQALDFLSRTILNFPLIDFLIDKFSKLLKVAKEYLGLNPSEETGAGPGRGGNAETLRLQKERGDAMKKAYDEEQAAVAATKERYKELQQEISKVGNALQRNYEQKLKDIAAESFLIGKSKDQIEVYKAIEDAAKDSQDAIQSLIDKRAEFSKKSATPDQQAQVGFINAEIKRVEKLGQIQKVNALNAVNDLQKVRMLENNRLQELKNIFELMDQIAQAQEEIASFQTQGDQARISAVEQVKALKEGFDLLMRREELERGILNLREQDKTAALQLFELENDRIKQLEEIQKIQNLPFEGIGGMKQQLEEVNAAYDARLARIKETQARTTEEQNSFSFGWAEATEKYRNSITTNAEYAGKTMQNFTKGIEDVFVKFVQTGKLSFKDLANSMIADFARIQAQKALLGIFDMGGANSKGSGFSFGTLFGSIGKIFGFANGGNPPVNRPSIVGERGPELFVPRNAGTIIPNGQFGGGGGNVTNVNYTISAVDASSFRSLIARDPEFIHNVSEQGRRSMPIRSRR